MTVYDLDARYGEMVPLDELALYFHAHVRAVRNALEAHDVPIFALGASTVVPLRAVERAFGLGNLAVDEDVLRHEAAKTRSSFHEDGSPKAVEEYLAEVEARRPALESQLDAARKRRGNRKLVTSR
jgi:hypothetical protein